MYLIPQISTHSLEQEYCHNMDKILVISLFLSELHKQDGYANLAKFLYNRPLYIFEDSVIKSQVISLPKKW